MEDGYGGRESEHALRRLDHQLRNELFGLQLRGDAADEAVKRRAELKVRLAQIDALLTEIRQRQQL